MTSVHPDGVSRPRRDAAEPEQRLNPSGVDDLSSFEVRMRMHALGWAVLPVLPHDVLRGGAGKAPALNGYTSSAFGYDKEIPAPTVIASWKSGSSGIGGTGICCNRVAGIDIDVSTTRDLSNKIRNHAEIVFGLTPFVRIGNSPKVLLVYRRHQSVKKLRLKCASGSGDGLDVIVDGHFVAYGIHPKTLKYYEWVGPTSPLTAEPEAAPLISQTQVDEFLARVQNDMDLNKSGGRAGIGNGQVQVTRDSSGLVVSGRDYHLYSIVRCAWHAMSREGTNVTVKMLADRAWEDFTATTNMVGTKENYREALKKASWRIKHQKTWRPERVVAAGNPTYRIKRASLKEAERDIERHIFEFGVRSAARRDAVRVINEEKMRSEKEAYDAMPF